jgi:lipopolysaccharide export system protein LptA
MSTCLQYATIMLVLLCVFVCQGFSQQDRVVLENADSLIGKILDGEDVRELIGHVRFRQGSVTVYCDRAIQYLQSRKVSLLGNVVMRDDTITMRGKRGMYYNTERIAEAFDGVQLEDGTTTLTANYGRYYVEDKKAFFRGNVLVTDTVSTLRANELTYFRNDKRSIGDGNVQIHTIEDNITVYGGHFENHPQQQFSRMTNRPRVVQIDTAEGRVDTFVVHSRVLESYRDSVRRLVAIDSVRMTSSQLSGESGHAVYFTDLDSIVMRKKPFIWYDDSQVTGDSIFIRLKNRKPEIVYIRGDAFVISVSDSLYPKRFNQLTGTLIIMYFDEGRIRQINVDQTATSVYFLYEDRNDTAGVVRSPNGLNKTSGDHVVIYFVDGRADKISVVAGVEGEYFPENMVEGKEQDYYLPGFNWREDRPGRFRGGTTNKQKNATDTSSPVEAKKKRL